MSFYTSDKYQLPIFRDCPRCKKSVSSDFSYCPHCGVSLIKQVPNYTDPTIRVYPNPQNIKIDPTIRVYPNPQNIKIDPTIRVYPNPQNIKTPEEFCSQCGQRIVRPNSLQTPNIYDSKIPNIYNPNNSGSSTSSSCFIATACNADVETLDTFYNFRDEILLRSSIGEKLVRFYYHFSPGVARLIQKSAILQRFILFGLLKPLAALVEFVLLRETQK